MRPISSIPKEAGLIGIALALWLPACGGSDSGGEGEDTDSKAEVVARADAICEQTRARLGEFGEPPDELSALSEYQSRYLSVLEDTIAELGSLRPPPADRQPFDRYLGAARELVQTQRELLAALEADDAERARSLLQEERATSAVAQSQAAAYGLRSCAQATS